MESYSQGYQKLKVLDSPRSSTYQLFTFVPLSPLSWLMTSLLVIFTPANFFSPANIYNMATLGRTTLNSLQVQCPQMVCVTIIVILKNIELNFTPSNPTYFTSGSFTSLNSLRLIYRGTTTANGSQSLK